MYSPYPFLAAFLIGWRNVDQRRSTRRSAYADIRERHRGAYTVMEGALRLCRRERQPDGHRAGKCRWRTRPGRTTGYDEPDSRFELELPEVNSGRRTRRGVIPWDAGGGREQEGFSDTPSSGSITTKSKTVHITGRVREVVRGSQVTRGRRQPWVEAEDKVCGRSIPRPGVTPVAAPRVRTARGRPVRAKSVGLLANRIGGTCRQPRSHPGVCGQYSAHRGGLPAAGS